MNDGKVDAPTALARLRQGNARFVAANRCIDTYLSHTRLDEHLEGQWPYAIVLGCSDSRVPVEIIFDVGVGDLFVVRVAGNIAVPSTIGSIEFAAESFGARLVVVLGHSECGAVDATLKTFAGPDLPGSANVGSIVASIRPAVAGVLEGGIGSDRSVLLNKAVRANVRAAVTDLKGGSETIERLARVDGLAIVGAEYSLRSGVVDFFDVESVPAAGS